MANPAFRLHGTGCGQANLVQGEIDFADPRLAPYLSRRPGDGGLAMGSPTRREDLERFTGRPWEEILADLMAARVPGVSREDLNAGGPALVSLALASQLLRPSKVPVTYYGLSGDDASASRLRWLLAQTPLDLTSFRQRAGRTGVTYVFNDSRSADGRGDRFFVHDSGTVEASSEILGESFFQATVNLYAGTALMPGLHRELPSLLAKSRRRGAFTVVGTWFDLAAEREGPALSLGGGETWPDVDLLVTDELEILRLTGRQGEEGLDAVEAAVDALLELGLYAAVVTRGAKPTYYRSAGGLFGNSCGEVPLHASLAEEFRNRSAHPEDATGAGDNFLGGLLASFFQQWLADDLFPKGEIHLDRELHHMKPLRLRPAVELGVAAKGLACLQTGGVHLERTHGERLAEIRRHLPAHAASGRWKAPVGR